MVTRKKEATAGQAFRVRLRAPQASDAAEFVAAARASRRFHAPWVTVPNTPEAFARYLRRYGHRGAHATDVGYLVVRKADDALVGAYNFAHIIRGALHGSFLGYYGFATTAGQGLMTEGLLLALNAAFGELRLHRVEVNVQPENARSLALIARLAFEREGYSRRYIKVGGRWRDHLRFAMLAEDWPARRRAAVAAWHRDARR
jgi:ribosomal-protein-alanine N-acetyltransferase